VNWSIDAYAHVESLLQSISATKENFPATQVRYSSSVSFFSAGIFFIFVFGILSVLFPLPDKIEYATYISDGRGQIVHAFLPKDQHAVLSKSHCNSVVTAVMT